MSLRRPKSADACATFENDVLGVVLSMKHEVESWQPQGSGSITTSSSTYGPCGRGVARSYVAATRRGGLSKSGWHSKIAKSGFALMPPRLAHRPGMLTRFTGTDENQGHPGRRGSAGSARLSENSPTASCFTFAFERARFITGHIPRCRRGHHATDPSGAEFAPRPGFPAKQPIQDCQGDFFAPRQSY